MALRTAVVIDYQNVHLTAHDVFDHSGEKHEALIHPMRFAETVIATRNRLQRPHYPPAVLDSVWAFRGLPHAGYDPEQNRRCSAQAREWQMAGTHVVLRDLKYKFQLQADGHPATGRQRSQDSDWPWPGEGDRRARRTHLRPPGAS